MEFGGGFGLCLEEGAYGWVAGVAGEQKVCEGDGFDDFSGQIFKFFEGGHEGFGGEVGSVDFASVAFGELFGLLFGFGPGGFNFWVFRGGKEGGEIPSDGRGGHRFIMTPAVGVDWVAPNLRGFVFTRFIGYTGSILGLEFAIIG